MGFRDVVRWFALPHAPAAPTIRLDRSRAAAQFSVNVPPEMLEAATAGGALAPRISRNEALQVPAVLRGRNLICSTLAALPLRTIGPDRRPTDGYLLGGNIDPDVANVVTVANTLEDLLFHGIAWWRVTRFGWHNYPVEARWVPESSVHVAGINTPLASSLISPDLVEPRNGRIFVDGRPVPDDEMIRFDSPNPALLRHAARAIRTALRLDRTSATFADEPMPQGIFTEQDGADALDHDEITQLLDDWAQARRTHSWAYLGGLKADTLTWSPRDLQLADTRQHAVLEIARGMGIDPEDLGVSTTSRTYANREQRNQHLLDFTLAAYVAALEQRLSMRDVVPRGYSARVEFSGFLRTDTPTRMAAYKIGLEVGAWTREEIREEENRPPLTPAQAQATPPAAAPVRAPAEPAEADAPASVSFTTGETRIAFDADHADVNFRVNPDKRTISGLVVPWGKVANNGQAKWRFPPGSLYWAEQARTKLNLHHDHTQVIAYASQLNSTTAGLDATFKVARGADGDRALSLAEDGVLDGFSIEIDFEDGDGWTTDPDESSVRLVTRAKLRGVALTGMPAFDDARVSAVAASLSNRKDPSMPTKTTEAEAGAAAPEFNFDTYMTGLADKIAESHQKLTEQLGESIGESVSAGVKVALETLPSPQDGPQPVRGARYVVTREAPVYTFTGSGHSLVRDAWHAGKYRDDESVERLRKYRLQTEEMAKLAAARFATITTGNASEVIPPGYRPDLYVAELTRGRPIVMSCSRGTIDSATPFVVPVFSSSTGATADHVEGTNPADGSITFGTKTVTPVGISGRMVLTREIADSANPAIDQIALATMRESYARQTEVKVYTEFNGANGAGGVITGDTVPSGAQASTVVAADTDAGDQALIKHYRTRLAVYPFLRFNDPDVSLMGRNVTTRFARAVDTTGRPLLPSVGAENTVGLGNTVARRWIVDGLAVVPSWAMTGVAAGDSQIFTLNSSDAWVWESPLLSFQYLEKSGPANIELAVFAYFATHLLRPVGLSGIRVTLV